MRTFKRHHLAEARSALQTHCTETPPKTECGCLHGGIKIENGRTRNPLTLWTVHVRVWVHILGDPQTVFS